MSHNNPYTAKRSGCRVAIVGAGPAGAMMAALLGRREFAVDVFGAGGDPREVAPSGPPHVGLLSARGVEALAHLDLARPLLERATPIFGCTTHSPTGALTFLPFGGGDGAIYAIERRRLTAALLDRAEAHAGVALHFDRACEGVDLAASSLTVEGSGDLSADLIIGADGGGSIVREAMCREGRVDFVQRCAPLGLKRLTIPPDADGQYALEENTVHVWPRGEFALVALPAGEGRFTCALFLPLEGPESFAALESDQAIMRFFQLQFPDVVPLMPSLREEVRAQPVERLVSTLCAPCHLGGGAVLLGDAASSLAPFYGLQLDAALEGCHLLDRVLGRFHGDLGRALALFSRARADDLAAAFDLSEAHRDVLLGRLASSSWLRYRWLEVRLHRLLGQRFTPLDAMVAFSTMGYAEARGRVEGRRRRLRHLALALAVAVVGLVGAALFLTLSSLG